MEKFLWLTLFAAAVILGCIIYLASKKDKGNKNDGGVYKDGSNPPPPKERPDKP